MANAFQSLHICILQWLIYHLLLLGISYPLTKWWFNSKLHSPFILIITVSGLIKLMLFTNIGSTFATTIGPASGLFLSMESIRLCMKIIAFTTVVVWIKQAKTTSGTITENIALDNRTDTPTEVSTNEPLQEQELMSLKHFLYFLFSPTLIYRPSYPMRDRRNVFLILRYSFLCFMLFWLTFNIFVKVSIPLRNIGVKPLLFSTFVRQISWSIVGLTVAQVVNALGFQEFWLNIFGELLKFGDRGFYGSWYREHELRRLALQWNSVIQNWLFEYINQPVRRRWGKRVAFVAVMFLSGLFHDYILALAVGWFVPFFSLAFTCFNCQRETHKRVTGKEDDTEGDERNNVEVSLWKYIIITSTIGPGMLLLVYIIEYYARQNCQSQFHPLLDYFIPRFPFCIKLVVRDE